jgi:hypothetical protein
MSNMSTATIPAEPTSQPDPNRAGTRAAMPRITRLLSLVHNLIAYGQNLLTTLQQNPSGPTFIDIAGGFGTIDIAAILARIACGLRRAAALEARLRRRAATGRDFLLDAPIAAKPAATDKPRAPRRPRPLTPIPAGLPTPEQIAAEVRYKPVGVVVEDICHELGILFGDIDATLYRQIFEAITYHNGNFARFFRNMMTRLRTTDELLREIAESPDTPATPSHQSPAVPPDAKPSIPPNVPPAVPRDVPPDAPSGTTGPPTDPPTDPPTGPP